MTKSKTDRKAKSSESSNVLQNNGTGRIGDVLDLREAAEYLRVADEEVLRMVATQGLPGRLIGSQWRFLKQALQNWLTESFQKKDLIGQLGKINDDPTIQEFLQGVYAQRGRPETAER